MSSSHSSLLTPNRLLITGGCGFIGLNLVKFFIKKGYTNIRILDNLSIGTKESLEHLLSELSPFTKKETKNLTTYSLSPIEDSSLLTPNSSLSSKVELIIGDIRSKQACLKATEDINAVIHLAAQAGVIPSIENPFYDCEINVLGTLNLLYAAVENEVDKFIFASSNAPLGEHTPPLSEEKIPKPLSPYGASKLACEAYCSAFYASYGLKTINFRFSNAYGPHCLHKNSVIAKFIKDGLLKEKLTIYGDGHQTRDFIHVDDICQAIYSLLTTYSSLLTNNVWGNVFHLGTGKETSILGLAKLIQGFFNKEIKISFVPERKGEIKRNYSDIGRAKKIFSFNPSISLEHGIKQVYEWFRVRDIEEIKAAQILSGSE